MSRLITTDFHIHTNHSLCGSPEATTQAVVQAAQDTGLEAIAITDHLVAPINFERPRLVREELPDHLDGLRVYVGGEVDMRARDQAAVTREYAAGLDLVVMSASHLRNIDGALLKMGPRDLAAFVLDLMEGAVETGYADVIAHAFHVPNCRHPFGDIVQAVDEVKLGETLAKAAGAGVAMEVNPRFLKAAPEQATWLFQLFLETGCKVSIGSDAHHPRHIGCRGDRFASEDDLRAIGMGEEHLFRIEDRAAGEAR